MQNRVFHRKSTRAFVSLLFALAMSFSITVAATVNNSKQAELFQKTNTAPQTRSNADPLPMVEWEKKQNADERLATFGDDLLGDRIDPHTGGISFDHTDIVLPGIRSWQLVFNDGGVKAFFITKQFTQNSEIGSIAYPASLLFRLRLVLGRVPGVQVVMARNFQTFPA